MNVGHKGKLKYNISEDHFQIGNMRLRFPNEILNFSCDCTIVKGVILCLIKFWQEMVVRLKKNGDPVRAMDITVEKDRTVR